MTTNTIVIGIAGEKGSGKDTACDFLVEKYGFRKVTFATPMKEIVERVFPRFPKSHLYGESKLREIPAKEYPLSGTCPLCSKKMWVEDFDTWKCSCGFSHPSHLTPRLALQTLGTEWGRRLYEDVWVDAAFAEIAKAPGRYCISDVRFPNEAKRILQHGGHVVRLKRKTEMKRNPTMWEVFRRLFGPVRGHVSETSLDLLPDSTFLAVVRNDSTIPVLHERVVDSIRKLL